ncbi:MAG TPA: hypothetical protein VKT99_05475 [Xanthobacteraceae bacterium]|jgi:putative transposase|nr:hypothetical protein [Xanthobacteraceae bacterium]
MSAPDRRQLVNRKHKKLSIRRQCALLGIARSGVARRHERRARSQRWPYGPLSA